MATALPYSPPLDPQEGFALWEVGQWRAGNGLYVPLEAKRFVSAPYPPLHPLLLRLIGSQHGPHVFWGGRVLGLIALIGLVVSAVVLVRRITASWLGGAAAALMILAQPTFQLWSMRIKPDLVGLLLSTVGLLAVAYGEGSSGPRGHAPSASSWMRGALLAIPFVLALYTKQTLVAGPFAAATLLMLRDRKMAAQFGVAFLLLLMVPWLSLDLATHGQYTYHVWILHRLGWTLALWLKLVRQLWPLWPAMLLGIAGIAATVRKPTIVHTYLLWAPLSLLGAGVQGAHHNHLLETGLALGLAGGQAIGFAYRTMSTRGGRHKQVVLAGTLALLAIQGLLLMKPTAWFGGEFTPDTHNTSFVSFVQATQGEMLADDVGLLYAGGKGLRYDDPSTMGPAAARGMWNESGLLEDIRNQRFSAIILPLKLDTNGFIDPAGHWTAAALQTIDRYYHLKFNDTQKVYVPRTTAGQR